MNNPLKYTDPSGYAYSSKRIEWENSWQEGMVMYYSMNQLTADMMSRMRRRGGGGGGSGFDPRGWSYNESTQEFYNGRTGEVVDARDLLAALDYMGVDYEPLSSMEEAYKFLGYSRTVLGTDKYGSQEVLYENLETGALKIKKEPFWKITGSYYNHDYFVSGVEAYGDMKFVMGLIGSKLDYSALIPAAFSLELNGSAEFYGAISTTPIGIIAAIRGQSAGNIRSFNSSGLGFGGASASTQFVKMRYHYFGSISNFSLENTFYGPSIDIEFSAGVFGVVAGTHVSLMFNATHQGDFMIGFGSYIGGGLPGLSGSGTYQSTDKW